MRSDAVISYCNRFLDHWQRVLWFLDMLLQLMPSQEHLVSCHHLRREGCWNMQRFDLMLFWEHATPQWDQVDLIISHPIKRYDYTPDGYRPRCRAAAGAL
jgi:hypothetical protein